MDVDYFNYCKVFRLPLALLCRIFTTVKCSLLFRWTTENTDIVSFWTSTDDDGSRDPGTGGSHDPGPGGLRDGGLSEEVLYHYRTPTSIDDVVQQRTLTVRMNCNNYVHRMHDLLRLEKYTQAKLIAESVTIITTIFFNFKILNTPDSIDPAH